MLISIKSTPYYHTMKNTHFLIAAEGADINGIFPDAFIGEIDGKKSASLKDFFAQSAEALLFPEEAGQNLDAFDEMLNDLDWIEESTVVIFISNSDEWLGKEKNEEKMLTVIDILDATAEDWKWMDEEDEESDKKELKIVFQDSERIRAILEEQEIPFGEF